MDPTFNISNHGLPPGIPQGINAPEDVPTQEELSSTSSVSSVSQTDKITAPPIEAASNVPQLEPPNWQVIQQGQPQSLTREDLTDSFIESQLAAYPELAHYLAATGGDLTSLVSDVRNFLLNNNPTGKNAEYLTGVELANKLELLSNISPNDTALTNEYNALRMSMWQQTNPEVTAAQKATIQALRQQGLSYQDALNEANAQIVKNVNDYMALNPTIGATSLTKAIGQAMMSSLGPAGNTIGGAMFVNGVSLGMNLESTLATTFSNVPGASDATPINLGAGIPKLDTGTMTTMLNNQEQMAKVMLDTLKALHLPPALTIALMQFLQEVLQNIAKLRDFMNQLEALDAQADKNKALGKIEMMIQHYIDAVKQLQSAYDDLTHALAEAKKWGKVAEAFRIINFIGIGGIAVIDVILIILLGPVGLIVALILSAVMVTVTALNETGKMSEIVTGLLAISTQFIMLCGSSHGLKEKDIPIWASALMLGGLIVVIFVVLIVIVLLVAVVILIIAIVMFAIEILMLILSVVVTIVMAIINIVVTAAVGCCGTWIGAIIGFIVGLIVSAICAIISVIIEVVVTLVSAVITLLLYLAVVIILFAIVIALIMLLIELLTMCIMDSGICKDLGHAIGGESSGDDWTLALTCMAGVGGAAVGAEIPQIFFDICYVLGVDTSSSAGDLQGGINKNQQYLQTFQNLMDIMMMTPAYFESVLKPKLEHEMKENEKMRLIFNQLLKLMRDMISKLVGAATGPGGGGGGGEQSTPYKDAIASSMEQFSKFISENMQEEVSPEVLQIIQSQTSNIMPNSREKIVSQMQKAMTPQNLETLINFMSVSEVNGQPLQFASLQDSVRNVLPQQTMTNGPVDNSAFASLVAKGLNGAVGGVEGSNLMGGSQ